jgi:hypothetical protein
MPKNNMSIGYVILESAPIEVPEAKVISEAGKRVIGEGIIQTAEEENRNGRCYLHQDLLREIQCPRTKELLSTGNMLSENGHPMDTSMMRQQTIEPNNTVARFLKIWMDGNNVMAHFKGTNNSKGEEFDQDLREGVLPSWSLRALGSLTNKGGRNIVENLRVITWDRVIFPSHPHAYTTRLVTESAALESSKIERINNNGMLIPITNDSVLSYIKNESANIKSLISQIDFMYESAKLVNPNQVQLVAKTGDIFVVNLEHHISNEIQNFCLNAGSILY